MNFFSKNWKNTVIVIAAIAAGCFAAEHFAGFNPVTVAANTVASPVKSGVTYIVHKLSDARDFIWDMRAYKADNEKLEAEIIELKREARDATSYKEENERLSSLLDLKNSTSDDYTTVAANVISYSQSGSFRAIEINRGSANAIAVGSPVITPDGIVGTVSEVGPTYAVVTTILDTSSVIGIKISRTDGTGLAEGDDELAKNLKCKLSFLDRNTPVIVGDVVETSGSGGIYPPGLVVGTVMNISANSAGSLNYAEIEPATDFSSLHSVLVIVGTK